MTHRNAAQQEIIESQDRMSYYASLRGSHDPTVYYDNSPKLLGSWLVQYGEYPVHYSSDDTKWVAGDSYMDIYLPPVGSEHFSLSNMRRSHHLLAQYMAKTGLVAERRMNICAITSEKLGRVVMRAFGARRANLPGDVLDKLAEETDARGIFERHVRTKEPFKPVFLYQTPEQYLGFYADSDPELAQYANNLDRLPDSFTTVKFGLGCEVELEELWTKDSTSYTRTVLY
jgi:hypothetical protein